MTDLKVGQVAILRTTDEPCLVLRVYEGKKQSKLEGLSGMFVQVRRPRQTDEGIDHVINEFYAEELESLEDKKKRVMDDYLGFEAAGKAAHAQGASAEVDGNTFRN